MTVQNSKMKTLTILVLFDLLIYINCNATNSSNGPITEFFNSSVLNETEGKDLTALSPVEKQTFLIDSNNTVFIIGTQSQKSSVNNNQSFLFSSDTPSTNSQIETDLIKEENTTSQSSGHNVSTIVFETQDSSTEPEVSRIVSDSVSESSNFSTTTLDNVNENLDLETTTFTSKSEHSNFETTTLSTVSENSDFSSTTVDTTSQASSFETTSDTVSTSLDFETTISGPTSESSDFETTTLSTVSESSDFGTTVDTVSQRPNFETTSSEVNKNLDFETTTSGPTSESSDLRTTTLGTTSEASNSSPTTPKVDSKTGDFEPRLENRSSFKLFCGYGSWASHRMGEGKFDVEDLDRVQFVLERCTHIIYAFAGLNSSADVMSLDPIRELDPNFGTFARLRFIKERHPHLKTLIAVGGWDTPSDIFSFLLSSERTRNLVAQSLPDFAKRHGFDGVVISWFHPGSRWRGGHPMDKQNFVTFLQELKLKLSSDGLELGVMGPAFEDDINSGYDIPHVSNSVDHLLLMTYDYHGSWQENANHFAPLYAANHISSKLNINHTLNYWIDGGAIRSKTVLGLATYGRSFTLADPSLNKPNSPSIGPGIAGPYTNRPGVVGFNEICEVFLTSPGVKLGEDDYKVTPYIHLYDQWIGFEDELSLFRKTLYAIDNKLEGVFLWSLDLDDFQNKCGWGHFPLLKASIQAIYRN